MNKIFNKLEFLILGLITLLFLGASAFAQTKSEILIVGDQKASCTGVALTECLQVKSVTDENFGLFYSNIEKFKYVPGYFYILQVNVSTVKNPPADASKYNYRLKKVLARIKSEDVSTMPATPTSAADSFSGTEWQLTKINNEVVGKTRAFIKFDENKMAVNGNGGCNVFGGKLVKNDKKITLSNVFSTKMFCQESQQTEDKFLGALDRVTTYEIVGSTLVLKADSETVLEFKAKK